MQPLLYVILSCNKYCCCNTVLQSAIPTNDINKNNNNNNNSESNNNQSVTLHYITESNVMYAYAS